VSQFQFQDVDWFERV